VDALELADRGLGHALPHLLSEKRVAASR
jgi:hypothetical protein